MFGYLSPKAKNQRSTRGEVSKHPLSREVAQVSLQPASQIFHSSHGKLKTEYAVAMPLHRNNPYVRMYSLAPVIISSSSSI